MEEKKEVKAPNSPSNENITKKKDDTDDLSFEDQKLKDDLNVLVESILTPYSSDVSKDEYIKLQRQAIDSILTSIRSATSTMTAIPKPLKFLRPHLPAIEQLYNSMDASDVNKPHVADILSVLSMTLGSDERLVLKYNLVGSQAPVESYGYEYIRCLSGEIAREYEHRVTNTMSDDVVDSSDLDVLIDPIIKYLFAHGGDIEACDLLLDLRQLNKLQPYISYDNVVRVGKYVSTCAKYLDETQYRSILETCYNLYMHTYNLPYALIMACHFDIPERNAMILRVFEKCEEIPEDASVIPTASSDKPNAYEDHVAQYRRGPLKAQLCYLLASLSIYFAELEDVLDEDSLAIVGNVHKSQHFKKLCTDLDAMKPKAPADVFKEHLEDGVSARVPRASSTGGPLLDSALQNMSTSFVNAFTNLGTGREALLTVHLDWLSRNKDLGVICATASLGLIHLWNVEEGYTATDVYTFGQESNIHAGALLANGVLSTGVTSELNATYAILSEVLENPQNDMHMHICACLGLGIAYIGTRNEEVQESLTNIISDFDVPFQVFVMAVLALGMVSMGYHDDEFVSTVLMSLSGRQEEEAFNTPMLRIACLGIALFYYGTKQQPQYLIDNLADFLDHDINTYLLTTAKSFAFAGSSNASMMQQFMTQLTENIYQEEDDEADEAEATAAAKPNTASSTQDANADIKRDESGKPYGWLRHIHQASALLGLSSIANGEHISQTMLSRMLDHVLQCSDVNLRRIIPLALAMNFASNPEISVIDSLTKLAHDQDRLTSVNACFAFGIVGAGTNNSRIAQILRSLAMYFSLEPQHLYCVRIAQGFLYMGKGLCSLDSHILDKSIVDLKSHAVLHVLLHCCFDIPNILIKTFPYLLYIIAPAIRPRQVLTIENDTPMSLSVRVGQAVDAVGQPGNPRTLTGFQTNNTPVLLANNERAEFVTDDYFPMTPIIDGVVVVRKNPDAVSKEI